MATPWTVTVDCAAPAALARFWALALGYVPAPPPKGYATWTDWHRAFGVPEEEWDDGAYLVDPDDRLPRLSFLKVPEGRTAKNRLHIDVQACGGRHVPWEERCPVVTATVERLVAAGATVVLEDVVDGRGDHVVLRDPEGNEFCVV